MDSLRWLSQVRAWTNWLRRGGQPTVLQLTNYISPLALGAYRFDALDVLRGAQRRELFLELDRTVKPGRVYIIRLDEGMPHGDGVFRFAVVDTKLYIEQLPVDIEFPVHRGEELDIDWEDQISPGSGEAPGRSSDGAGEDREA